MPKKTLLSRHINKSKLNDCDAAVIERDIMMFNAMKRRAFRLDACKAADLPKSVHLMLKDEFGVNDYFANSAHNEAKAVRRSAGECLQRDIEEKSSQITQMKKKLRDTERRLAHLLKEKESLKKRSIARKAGKKDLPKFHSYSGSGERLLSDGTFETGKHRKTRYENEYLFEVLYLDPEIKKLRHRIRSIEKRMERTAARLAVLKEKQKSGRVSVCFGSKELFHRQFSGDLPHEVWKARFDRARNRNMTISGRHDASGGNFVFRYDPEKRLLKYRSMSGADIYLPCEFPYGQALVERAVSLPECSVINGKEVRRHAVCWGVEDCGNSFIVKCTVEIDMPDMNCCRSDGVVAFDTNADNISFAETDASGNLLRHGIIHFDLEGKSSEQTEYILSSALETVFRYAESVRKPVVLEKLEDIKQESLYRGKRLNRVLSMFACSKITELAMSKSVKYRLHVIGVNPAFTSQMGKVKYMRRHGLSVHEAAAYVIARRGMGLSEKLPAQLMELIPAKKRDRHHWSHWRYLHNKLKEIPWQSCYGKIINAGSVNAA